VIPYLAGGGEQLIGKSPTSTGHELASGRINSAGSDTSPPGAGVRLGTAMRAGSTSRPLADRSGYDPVMAIPREARDTSRSRALWTGNDTFWRP